MASKIQFVLFVEQRVHQAVSLFIQSSTLSDTVEYTGVQFVHFITDIL